jgi:pyruvate,water dikinase
VGRKARTLALAEANGLSTPGGWVIPSDVFWAALEDCGVAGRARYLQASMLGLEPAHVLGIAASIASALQDARLERLAAAPASTVFERLGAPVLACRSSAAMEDGADAAFPGIFSSRLNIRSADALAVAIADAWRSGFSQTAMRYILRLRPADADLSLALLIQRQVDARIFGLWFGADPSANRDEPVVELSLSGPEALVGGLPPSSRLTRRFGRWTGPGADVDGDGDGELTASLVALEAAAGKLEIQLGAPADIEFALPDAGDRPVILQARPITRVDPADRARRVAGFAVRPQDIGAWTAAARDDPSLRDPLIAIIDGLDGDSYDLAFRCAGVVVERLVSRLGHFSILCRELGVPIVSGVPGAAQRLVGRYIAIDEAANSVETLDSPPTSPSSDAPPQAIGVPRAVITTTELIIRLLAKPPGIDADPHGDVLSIARACGRSLGAREMRIVALALSPADLDALDRLGRPLYGEAFSAARLAASLPSTLGCRQR